MESRKAKKSRKFVGGVIVNSLPSVKAILSQYDLDRELWCFREKRQDGTEEIDLWWNANVAGCIAGHTTQQGYVRIKVNGQNCAVHRLIWKVLTGKDPEGFIDHINGMRDDNRPENLRDVTPRENCMNAIKDRWRAETERRNAIRADQEAKERAEKIARIEKRERELLAKLKAKYELSAAE